MPPFQLSADADVLASADTVTCGYEEYSRDNFIFDRDTRLHLGLVPLPYGGDLRSAKVFVLMLNPGLGPSDYYAEQTSREWRDLLDFESARGRSPEEESFYYHVDVMQAGVVTPVLLLLLSAEAEARIRAFRALESFFVLRMICRQTAKDY